MQVFIRSKNDAIACGSSIPAVVRACTVRENDGGQVTRFLFPSFDATTTSVVVEVTLSAMEDLFVDVKTATQGTWAEKAAFTPIMRRALYPSYFPNENRR